MRLIRSAILIAVGLGVLALDAGESWRAGQPTVASASAASHHHHRRHHRHRRHHPRRHHRPPATEM